MLNNITKNITDLFQSNTIPLSTIIFTSLAFIGIILCIIFSFLKKDIGTAYLVGYGLVFFSISFLFLLAPYYNYISILFPLFLSIIIGGIIYQTGFNLEKINKGKMPPDYYKFSSFIAFLLGGQIILYVHNILSSLKIGSSSPTLYRNILISALLFLISIFMVYTNQIIITKFTTDG